MIDADDLIIWVDAYLEWKQDPSFDEDNPHWCAVEKFMDEDTDPEDCWLAILAILSKGPAADVLGDLAAGPLEDLIECHGPQFIERIEAEARRSHAFRDLLSGVWESSTPEIWVRVETARAK